MKLFRRNQNHSAPCKLPTGCFSVDRGGAILASTLPHSFPTRNVQAIAEVVISLFRSAPTLVLPLSEIHLQYEGLTITARELRGGAIVFLTPRVSLQT